MRIVLFKGQSQYGSLRLHVDQLAAALSARGDEAQVIDLATADAASQLQLALERPPDAFVGFGGVGSELKLGERSAYDQLDAIYVALHVDHPLYHLPRIAAPAAKKVLFFLDRSHVRFVNASPLAAVAGQVGFLPPGANELAEPADLSDEAFAARDIDVLFTGTYRGEPPTPWRDWPESPARTLVEGLAERMAADARLPVLEAFAGTLRALGADPTPQLFQDCLPLLLQAQAFAEAYHRSALLTVLGAAEVPLQVWGAGWEPLAERFASFDHRGVGSFAETLLLLRRARVVLNINNGFIAGGHERVFTAMAGGAAVFSDRNPYYESAFQEGREIVTFAWPKMHEAPARLAAMVTDAGLAKIARAGAERVQAEHRWEHRARLLVEAVSRAR